MEYDGVNGVVIMSVDPEAIGSKEEGATTGIGGFYYQVTENGVNSGITAISWPSDLFSSTTEAWDYVRNYGSEELNEKVTAYIQNLYDNDLPSWLALYDAYPDCRVRS